jgi:hypothetical protein
MQKRRRDRVNCLNLSFEGNSLLELRLAAKLQNSWRTKDEYVFFKLVYFEDFLHLLSLIKVILFVYEEVLLDYVIGERFDHQKLLLFENLEKVYVFPRKTVFV